jgi:hypothetical protein
LTLILRVLAAPAGQAQAQDTIADFGFDAISINLVRQPEAALVIPNIVFGECQRYPSISGRSLT